MFFLVSSRLVKLETSHTVTLPPMVSALCVLSMEVQFLRYNWSLPIFLLLMVTCTHYLHYTRMEQKTLTCECSLEEWCRKWSHYQYNFQILFHIPEQKVVKTKFILDSINLYISFYVSVMELFSRIWRLVSAQVDSCCVYETTKQKRQCMKGNNQICLTIGQIGAFISS